MRISEEEALGRLRAIREIFDLSVGAFALLTEEPARSELSKYVVRYNDMGVFQATKTDPAPEGWQVSLEIRFLNTDYRRAAAALLERSKRQAIIESFDVVRQFVDETPNWDVITLEPWFYFTMFYRNAVAHNGRWMFGKKDKARLPIRFMNIPLDESMEDQNIDGFLNLWQARQLLAKMELFVLGHRNLL